MYYLCGVARDNKTARRLNVFGFRAKAKVHKTSYAPIFKVKADYFWYGRETICGQLQGNAIRLRARQSAVISKS